VLEKIRGNTRVNSIDTVIRIADKKGGKVLSEVYINYKTKMKFECSKGHQWFAQPYNVLYNNTWCPKCGVPKRLELKDIKDIAISRGGICLSDEYINSRHKLQFQCSEGHVWMAQADRIKKGTWCRICSYKKPRRNTKKRK